MLKPEQVPKASADAVQALISRGVFTSTEEAIAAALNAWPGMGIARWAGGTINVELPLPTEASDAD